jgi:hypothetical protein
MRSATSDRIRAAFSWSRTDMWQPVTLSRRQAKSADRVGGCEIILPWPEGLPLGPPLTLDEERDTSRSEHAAAEQIITPAAREHDLVPVRSAVAMLMRPWNHAARPSEVEQHLIILLVGRRWVHATGRPEAAQSWHTIGRIEVMP